MTIGNISNVSTVVPSYPVSSNQRSSMMEELQRKREEAQEEIASGKKINDASDNPAGLAIAEQILSSYNHLKGTSNNIASEINRINVGDSTLSGVQDSLSRMQELSLQASNGTLTDSDRQMIQTEIDEIKGTITDSLSHSEFNTQELFDGELGSLTLEELGLEDFDVTQDFSVDTLTDAMDQVSSLQGQLGAESNGLEHEYNYSTNAALNQQSSYNQIVSADISKSITNMQVQQALSQYQYQAQNLTLSTSFINLTM